MIHLRQKTLPLVGLILIAFLINAEVLSAASLRTLKVGIAVSKGYKNRSDWKATFEKRLAYASKIFKNEFNIAFKPKTYWNWPLQDETGGMDALYADLSNRYALGKVDLVIGLSSISDEAIQEAGPNTHILGRARPFFGFLVLRKPINPLFQIQQETVLLHEIGHLFGAVHTKVAKTIMSPVIDRQIPTQFDSVNREILKVTRGVDFRHGADALDDGSIKFLLGSYQKMLTQGQSYEFYYAMGNLYLRLGQTQNAITALKKAIRLNDKHASLQHDMGVLYLKAHNYSQAITHLNRAIALLKSGKNSSYLVSAHQMVGRAYFEKGNYTAAYQNWIKALGFSPDNHDLHVNLAAVHLKQKRYQEAIKELEIALQKGGEDARLYNGIAIAYYESGDYKSAIQYFRKTLDAPSVDSSPLRTLDAFFPAQVHTYIGFANLQLGRQSEAMTHFQTACRMDPSIECDRQVGQLHFQMGQWKQATEALFPVLAHSKQDADLYGMLGVAFNKLGDSESAEKVFKQALRHIQNRQTQALFHTNLGNIYIQRQDADHAVRQFRFAIDKKWDHANGHVGLAIAYLAQNEVDLARRSAKQALAIEPHHAQAKKVLQQIGG